MRFRYRQAAFLLLLLLLPQLAWSQATAYVTRGQIDFSMLLAPPPAVGSAQQKLEMDELVTLQKNRTQAQEAFAQADAERSVFRFADVLGEGFSVQKLPQAAVFFENVKKNADEMIGPAKSLFNRPRPYATNPELHPCVPKPHNASYPSGHSTFGTVMSIVLADMVPEKREQLFDRAELYRRNRMIGGAHYESDIQAGRICGTVIAAFLFQNPAFQADYAKTKAEVRAALNLR